MNTQRLVEALQKKDEKKAIEELAELLLLAGDAPIIRRIVYAMGYNDELIKKAWNRIVESWR